ncbi:MAG: agmatine deiminase family protein [Pseudomonadota bacterium]
MKSLLFVLISLTAWASASTRPSSMKPTTLEEARAVQHNSRLSRKILNWNYAPQLKVERPFSELEKTGYLLFHSDTYYKTSIIKDTLASHLPAGVKLIVYTNQPSLVSALRSHYEPLAGKTNVEVLGLRYPATDRAIWARDNTPIPVLLQASETETSKWGAIDAVYYGGDEPDSALASFFHINLGKNPYQFEGGNFVTDPRGNCVIVNKRPTAEIPDSVFTEIYGCKKVVRLKHVSGIGHADERVKFINESTVLTDTEIYVPQLSALGYEVRVLPTPLGGRFRTYVNSLSIENKIFVPVFDQENDAEALAVYRSFGLDVIPLNTEDISDNGNGSIHCITMTYPRMELSELKNLLFR